jgi:hypothetical protein
VRQTSAGGAGAVRQNDSDIAGFPLDFAAVTSPAIRLD